MEGCEDVDARVRAGEFDIRAGTEFWDEIKRGLVLEHYLPILVSFDMQINIEVQNHAEISHISCYGACQGDEERLVRKQSLHILKTVLQINGGSQCYSGVSEKKSQEKNSVPHGMTKREMWADKEAKSLGVGKLCNSVDFPLNVQQQWEAFLLLYEMLEEYGTHLVEAAWSHQVLNQISFILHVIN